MADGLELEKCSEIVFEGEKALEAGVVYGHPIDTMYLRFVFPEIDETMQVIMTEIEALAVIHMLSGVLLTTLADQVEEDGDTGTWPSRELNGSPELGQSNPTGSPITDD